MQDRAAAMLQLSWRSSPDMPFAMGNYVQSAAVHGRIYVGGGDAEDKSSEKNMSEHDRTVMEYSTATEKWEVLPQYTTSYFAMTVIDQQLVLVGGYVKGGRSKELAVWSADSREWSTHIYPPMHTARGRCSAVCHKKWLVVAGGWSEPTDGGHALCSVEVMDTANKQWHAGPPTPTPWFGMRATVLNDVFYFMGGYIPDRGGKNSKTSKVYSAPLRALLATVNPASSSQTVWAESSLPFNYSTPLSFGGSLLAVGGADRAYNSSPLIHCYQPDTEEWVRIGELPTPRSKCSCVLLGDGQIMVAGGNIQSDTILRTVEICALAT